MRILFVLNNLKNRTGMVLHVRDLAMEVHRRGHLPEICSPIPGDIGDELLRSGIRVVTNLDQLTDAPDLIHGHTQLETVTALLRYPDVAAVSTLHALSSKNSAPPPFTRLLRYIPVSTPIRDRLVQDHGVPDHRIQILLNPVDLTRFAPRGPLPERPSRALMFNGLPLFDHFPTIERICKSMGMTLDVIGGTKSQRVADPWRILGQYDVVFARSRCALESIAVGAAVIVCAREGVGSMVTTENYATERALNFGADGLIPPATPDAIVRELQRYDPRDAAEVSRELRSEAGLDRMVDAHLELYQTVIEENRHVVADPVHDLMTAGNYLTSVEGYNRKTVQEITERLTEDRDKSRRWAEKLVSHRLSLTLQVREQSAEVKRLRAEVRRLERGRNRLQARIQAVERSLIFRVQRRLSGVVTLLRPDVEEPIGKKLPVDKPSRPARVRSHAPEIPPMPIIVGAPRSGTTLLRFMLDAHPEMAIPPETGFLVLARRFKHTGEELREEFFSALTTGPAEQAWQDFGVPADQFLAALQQIRPFSAAEGYRAFYRMYAARFGKSRWGDKTPLYCRYLSAIEAVLPEAHFIHIIRDGRDVALSLRPLWFSPGQSVEEQAEYWLKCVTLARQQGPKCRKYLEVRFEDLVRDSETVLRQICEFTGLPYSPQLLQYHQRTRERLQEQGDRRRQDGSLLVTQADVLQQHALVMEPPQTSRIEAWRHEMTAEERRRFEAITGPLLSELGYALPTLAVPH